MPGNFIHNIIGCMTLVSQTPLVYCFFIIYFFLFEMSFISLADTKLTANPPISVHMKDWPNGI